ncbi:class I fructose-bisphosphate aldolase [Succinatimonas hippei]|uniref:class I fructose-bisphosphate aldolase n=1 Tax=Succinatimonas hippei TaxID=626938 RepID=UPI0024930D21|nr:fructose-bisphosphate aldolase [Succinatimonas hippei]
MLLGEYVHLNRLLSHSNGKYLGITVDHAMARGVLPGLEHIDSLIGQIVEGAPDALTMHKGIASYCYKKYAGSVPLVVKCTTFSPVHPDMDVKVCTVKEALSLGADAISVGAIVLGKHQPSQLETLSELSCDAHSVGLPVLAHIYPRGLENKADWTKPQNVKYAVRLGAELGVNIVKTMYTGDVDSFATVVESTPAKVAVAGGDAGLNSVAECLQLARDVIDAGGVGITFGRCIFQYENPTALIKALGKVIHEGYSVKDALDFLNEELSK